MKALYVAMIPVLLLLACRTVPTDIPEDLTQPELIQLAQQAADQENWAAALAYYQAIVERYPEDRTAIAIARYEMAFIEYRRGDLAAAETRFEELVAMYDDDSSSLPAWPLVLSQRIVGRIEEERGPDSR